MPITNDIQERQIHYWLSNPEVHHIDTLDHDEISGAVKCHIFGQGIGDDLELVAIGSISEDGDWYLTSASPGERYTIHPMPDEAES